MKRFALLLIGILIMMASCQRGRSGLKLPSLISDNMVLQQKTDVRIWGEAAPGQKITVVPEWGSKVTAKTSEKGKWLAVIKSPEAGGPYRITVSAKDTTIIINNVLIGEVWFCSGQSNMEMPMSGWPPVDTIMHSSESIAAASIPEIRLFIVQRKVSGVPLDECTGRWEVCSPESVKPFSATAFFFGRKLYSELKEPVGLIESAWGGTPSEAWTSADALEGAGEFTRDLTAMSESAAGVAKYRQWLEGHKQMKIKPAGDDQWADLDFGDSKLASAEYDDTAWPVMKLPGQFEPVLGEIDGAVWFRKTVELPGETAGRDLILSLGPIDDMDITCFNGNRVGAIEKGGFWQTQRSYRIPGYLVMEGKNTIAVRVLDTQGGGGINGAPGSMKIMSGDGKSVISDIGGDWKYQPVAELDGDRFFLFDFANNDFSNHKRPETPGPYSPSTLFNGMVNPVLNYRIKGAIWYQGEANVGRSEQYEKIFPVMIENWRDKWQISDFPFYFVQIAPWIYSGLDSTNSVLLREAQARSLSVPETGMVVTLDIATVMNIHPPYKTEVGERLANLALANDYGKNVVAVGPVLKSISFDGSLARISFSNAESGLVSTSEQIPEFEIAGTDGKFIKAAAMISGDEVLVSSPEITEPKAVRYCWRNGATGSLFSKEGLPASQFNTSLNH